MQGWQLYIRHAHRDTSDPEADNGLTDKGRRQGKELIDELKARKPLRKPRRVISSPKLRCLETAAFVAEWLDLPIEIDERLDTQRRGETDKQLEARVKDFFEAQKGQGEICFVTHGDVLPHIGRLGGRGPVDIRKGGYFWLEPPG